MYFPVKYFGIVWKALSLVLPDSVVFVWYFMVNNLFSRFSLVPDCLRRVGPQDGSWVFVFLNVFNVIRATDVNHGVLQCSCRSFKWSSVNQGWYLLLCSSCVCLVFHLPSFFPLYVLVISSLCQSKHLDSRSRETGGMSGQSLVYAASQSVHVWVCVTVCACTYMSFRERY